MENKFRAELHKWKISGSSSGDITATGYVIGHYIHNDYTQIRTLPLTNIDLDEMTVETVDEIFKLVK